MSTAPVVKRDDLAEMLEEVWISYVDPEGLNPVVPTGDAKQSSDVHSSVSISGAWTGHLVYASSNLAARRATGAFLAMEPAEVSPDDVADVLGELANIIGGNVKAMLPPGCFLSLPQVVLAPESATSYPHARQISNLHGVWDGEPVSVSVWQSSSDLKEENSE